jgi:antirestriction protein ArdC
MSTIATTSTVNSSTQNPKQQQSRTAKEVIAANVQFLIQQLETGHSEALTAYLDAMVHFHNYSFGNILAIARQNPQATNVAGMWAWNQLGRRVKRGEKGIAILAPMIAKTRNDKAQTEGEDSNKPSLLGFRKVYVWDDVQGFGIFYLSAMAGVMKRKV